MRHKSNLKELKDRNKKLILKLLINKGPMSRSELSQYTGLSMTAVSDLVNELINENLIMESGIGASTGGRRPILLEFNPEGGYIVGVKVKKDKIIAMLFNFNINKIAQREMAFNCFEISNLEAKIKECVISLEDEFCKHNKKIFGMGICLEKDIKALNPRGILTTSVSAEYMTLDQALSIEFGIIVVEEDEINLKALAEYKNLKCDDNLAYININDSIESSIIINGKYLETGINIGHIIIDKNGPKCSEGHKGCLNTLVSVKAIIKKALIMMIEEPGDEKNKIADISSVSIDNLPEFLNEEKINRLINEISDYLKIVIINLKNLLDIKTFVFEGKIFKISGIVNILAQSYENLIVKKSSVGDQEIMREAARIALRNLINIQEV